MGVFVARGVLVGNGVLDGVGVMVGVGVCVDVAVGVHVGGKVGSGVFMGLVEVAVSSAIAVGGGNGLKGTRGTKKMIR